MKYTVHIPNRLWSLLSLIATSLASMAFSLDTYAPHSVLSEGKWVKISVAESGIYKLSRAQLQQWGFPDPAKVNVYGYGGNRIPNKLTEDAYVDDLPPVASMRVPDGGIVFYAVGPEQWAKSSSGHMHKDLNIYTNAGYYFLSDREAANIPEIPTQGSGSAAAPAETFIERLHYERDLTSPGEAGFVLVGENFKLQNEHRITFETPDPADNPADWGSLECGMVTKSFNSASVNFTVNGQQLQSLVTDRLSTVSNNAYTHGAYNTTTHKLTSPASRLEIKVAVPASANTQGVWLDYLSVNYTRRLALPSAGYLNFWSKSPDLKLTTGSHSDVVVWDVTDPKAITRLNTSVSGQSVAWSNDYTGERAYAAFSINGRLPSPTYAGTVANQDIHAMESPQMIIFTLPEYRAQAHRIADLHATSPHPITALVLNVEDVYNEFASGSPDVSALRKCLKMFYDRSAGTEKPLSYCLLLGRCTYDNRHLTSQFAVANAHNTIPYWMGGSVASQFSDNTAFGTDDFIAMLADGSGSNMGYDDLSIAVGRIPVTSVNEARNYTDKLYQYVKESSDGTWKNTFLFLADDGDNGVHMQQTEDMINYLAATPDQHNFINKVYVDAYNIVGGVCVEGREEMYRMLKDGVVWWNYSGHANNHSWTGEGMLTYTDINNMYLRRVPIVLAATCDFLRWDSNVVSGGEILLHERNGGAIAMISATRPVYITENGKFTKAVGRAISRRDSAGMLPRIGDIYRMAKNDIQNDSTKKKESNPNRLRYVLMGDPAMMLPTPSNLVKIETINGQPLTPENQVTLRALEHAEIAGSICAPDGSVLDQFEGAVQINIYDANQSRSTKGQRKDNVKKSFEDHGGLLYAGSGKATAGKFLVKVAMPGDVTDNFRPALMNAYAVSDDRQTEAVGTTSDFYIYGYDDSVEADTEAPTISAMILNHSSFSDGSAVNDSPMVIASVSDNVGINLSAAGIGHQMTLTLDGKRIYTDVALYYIPSADGSPSGEIRYPMSGIAPGPHTLTLKVWDTAANSATRDVSFTVEAKSAPTIFDVYTDVNPASTEVKFFISHNRPDAQLTATVTVYDLLGHPLWTTTQEGLSDMFVSAPITWDLTDQTGRRLPRGIYLYRATISTDKGDTYDSAARRLAVTAQ